PRRDGGFTIFYMGINLGAFFSPLVCGTLGENIGWHWGFGAAGIGMIAGLLVFVWGQRLLGTTGFPPGRPVDPSTRLNAADWRDIVLITLASCALVWLVIAVGGFVGKGTMFVGGLAVTGAAIAGQRVFSKTEAKHEPLTKEEWQRIAVIAILAFFNIFFWMGFEQAGGTFTLF